MIRVKTNRGSFALELDVENAPITSANFEAYVKSGFYNGTIFHRIIPGFMVQGGGFNEDMEEKPTQDKIKNEADNGLKNLTGTLAMARTPDPDSASSQFFINVNDNDFLNHTAPTESGWGYCVFAKIVEGMETVMEISHTATGSSGHHQDVPIEPVIVESIEFDD